MSVVVSMRLPAEVVKEIDELVDVLGPTFNRAQVCARILQRTDWPAEIVAILEERRQVLHGNLMQLDDLIRHYRNRSKGS